MKRSGSSWWRALAVLPVLAAVLLLHGLDARAGHADPANAVSVSVAQVEATAAGAGTPHTNHEHHDGCDDCAGAHHLLIACVAIVATVVTWAVARRVSARPGRAIRAPGGAAARLSAGADAWAPPDPAWVRLCVMRC